MKLKPFQRAGLLQMRKFGGQVLLGDEMGLGKTIQALFWVMKHPRRRPVVIVCPASLKWNWHSEALNLFGLRAEVLSGRPDKRRAVLPAGDIYVLNYDIMAAWLPALRRRKPQILICDEAHFLTNPRAQRTKAVTKLARKVPHRLALSGTPFSNRPIELWPVLRIVKPKLFPSRQEYAWRYCRPRFTPWGWRFDGATNTEELNRILRQSCLIRRLKQDVLKELPSKQYRTVMLRLPRRARAEYEEARQDFIKWLTKISPAKAMRAKRSQAMSKIGYLLRLAAQLKMPLVFEWINDFFEANPDKKLVCFTSHTATVDAMTAKYPQALVINGAVASKHRAEIVRLFQNNPRRNLFVGNWRAAGVGLTLTAAHNVVALDLPWTYTDFVQGGDRAHRIGQHHNVIIHTLLTLDTLEEKQAKILRQKQQVMKAVIDGQNGRRGGADLFDALFKTITKDL